MTATSHGYWTSPSVPIAVLSTAHHSSVCPGIRSSATPPRGPRVSIDEQHSRAAKAVRRARHTPAAGPGRRDASPVRSGRAADRGAPDRGGARVRRDAPGARLRARRRRPRGDGAAGDEHEHGTPAAGVQPARLAGRLGPRLTPDGCSRSGCSIPRRGSSSIGQSGGLISRWFQVRVLAPLPTRRRDAPSCAGRRGSIASRCVRRPAVRVRWRGSEAIQAGIWSALMTAHSGERWIVAVA